MGRGETVTQATKGRGARFSLSIIAEKNQFADEFLDVIGNEFKFDHSKGMAEWMKNSADAYATSTVAKEQEHYILLRFKIATPKKHSVFECIDFVGMTKADIDNAFKQWGSTSAAKRGKDVATFGGHGNGGKFYMRQMFSSAHFITYRGGKLNVFGFDQNKRYGYASGKQNLEMSLDKALKYAGLDSLDIPVEVRGRWTKRPKDAGFTVVRGEGPERFSGRSTVTTLLERLRTHPQARRILRHKPVFYLPEGKPWGERLLLPDIKPREGFETPREIPLPRKLAVDGEDFDLTKLKGGKGKLTLRTSALPLSRSGDLAAMNTIDVLGEVGCIGSYRMNELGFMRNSPESEFIMGEVEAPFLEGPKFNSVSNDREKLIKNPLTAALLAWVRAQVDDFAGEMAEKTNSEKRNQDLRTSALFNQLLDKWKNRFMTKLTSELFGGSGIGDSFGGAGGGGGADGSAGHDQGGGTGGNGIASGGGDEDGRGSGEKGGSGGGSGTDKKSGPRFPRVLLSSHDQDPLSANGEKLHCDPRHPPVYQRRQDIDAGIYWINTSRPFAEKHLAEKGANSVRWREYLFQRYVDIILKQSVYELGKRDPAITPDKIDNLIDEITSRVHDGASRDLETFLFEENMSGAAVAEVEAEEAAAQ